MVVVEFSKICGKSTKIPKNPPIPPPSSQKHTQVSLYTQRAGSETLAREEKREGERIGSSSSREEN